MVFDTRWSCPSNVVFTCNFRISASFIIHGSYIFGSLPTDEAMHLLLLTRWNLWSEYTHGTGLPSFYYVSCDVINIEDYKI